MTQIYESDEQEFSDWKESVKKKYPQLASKMKFTHKSESSQDKNQVIATIDGEDRCYGTFDLSTMKGEVLGEMKILQGYLESMENIYQPSFEVLEEALKMAKVTVYLVTPKDIPDLKKDVFGIKNESPVVEFLVTLLGIPRDGTVYKIRTGYMSYQEEHKILLFASNKFDLPRYLNKRTSK